MNKPWNRYEPHEQTTPCGKMFRVLDTANGKYVSMSFHQWDEAKRICDRLNKPEGARMDYQKTPEAQEFENQAAIVCYSRMAKLGFQADPFKSFEENLIAFADKHGKRCSTDGCEWRAEYCYACYRES